jgi:hypothetical protein
MLFDVKLVVEGAKGSSKSLLSMEIANSRKKNSGNCVPRLLIGLVESVKMGWLRTNI